MNNINVSKFLLPFYLKVKNERELENVFPETEWNRPTVSTVYLTKYMEEIYNNIGKNPICRMFSLKDEARDIIGIPQTNQQISTKVSIIDFVGTQMFYFYLGEVSVYYFATGIGFLVFSIEHAENESMNKIVDKCFAISNIFTNEHDSGKQPSKIEFHYANDKSNKMFSLKNIIYALLKTEKLAERMVLFPTNSRRKLNVYHKIYLKKPTEDDSMMIDFLCKGLHSEFVKNSAEDADILSYSSTENTGWQITSNGVVFVTYDRDDNRTFLVEQHARNVLVEYFSVYVFALHERENLLRYNYRVVKNWNNSKKLLRMKSELMRFRIWSGYNTVSNEMAYQKFYNMLYKALELENLGKDVHGIIEQVNEHETVMNEKKWDAMLAIITFLTVFSTFADSFALVDWIYTNELKSGHICVASSIFTLVLIGILFFFRKKK